MPDTDITIEPTQHPGRKRMLRVVVALVLVAVLGTVILWRDKLNAARLQTLGYAGVFLMALAGSSAMVLPIPHLAFTFTMGAVLNPWIVGLAGGLGDALGEIIGYLAHYAVEDLVEHHKAYAWLKRAMDRNGDVTIFVSSLLPIAFFHPAAMAGGLLGYPLRRFVPATWAGKTIKAVAAAWAGHLGVRWVVQLLHVS